MKIRNGFVSNSSSTSFCIYGTDISDVLEEKDYTKEEYVQFFKSLNLEIPSYIDEYSDDTIFESCDVFDAIFDSCGLTTHFNSDRGYDYVGQEWSEIGDNETGSEFRNRIENTIKNIIPNVEKYNLEFYTCEDSYYS